MVATPPPESTSSPLGDIEDVLPSVFRGVTAWLSEDLGATAKRDLTRLDSMLLFSLTLTP